jgi:hypothetical protein
MIQDLAVPRAGSNRDAVRHSSTNTSWVTSSACAGSRTTLTDQPEHRGATRR